jgi:voltage-gated potassium channel
MPGLLSRIEQRRRSGAYERYVARTDLAMTLLAVAFLFALALPLLVDLTPTGRRALTYVNAAVWLVFAVDYLIRLYLARQRWAFIKSHVADLVVVLVPMLRPLRVLRLMRLMGAAGLAKRVATSSQRSLHERTTAYMLLCAVLALIVAAVGVYDAERKAPEGNIDSFGDALWWAATTVTTVGYGDQFPTTVTGRFIAVGLMLVGIALLGVITASVAAWFVRRLTATQGEVEQAVREESRTVEALLEEVLVRLDRIEARQAGGQPPAT